MISGALPNAQGPFFVQNVTTTEYDHGAHSTAVPDDKKKEEKVDHGSVVDTACGKTCCGRQRFKAIEAHRIRWAKANRHLLDEAGLGEFLSVRPKWFKSDASFIFGDGKRKKAHSRVLWPTLLPGESQREVIFIEIELVDGLLPLLLSLVTLERMQLLLLAPTWN